MLTDYDVPDFEPAEIAEDIDCAVCGEPASADSVMPVDTKATARKLGCGLGAAVCHDCWPRGL